jgi:hypothetical protein
MTRIVGFQEINGYIMTKVLLFESDYDAVLADNIKVVDGMVEIEGKSMMVDKAVPVNLRKNKKLFGSDKEPLYILKWNSIEPAVNIHKPVGKMIGFHPAIQDSTKAKLSHKSGIAGLIKHGDDEIVEIDAKPVRLKFTEDHIVTPEMLRKLIGLKILGNMIKTKKDGGISLGGSKKIIAFLIAGLGATIVFLYMNGYIKF